MTERTGGDRNHDLDRDLARLATDAIFPPTPIFAMPRATAPARDRAHFPKPAAWWKAGLAAVVLIATAVAIPETRGAVADWLGFPGIRIEIGDRPDDPSPTVTSIGGSLLLGNAVTMDEAEGSVSFDIVVPGALIDDTSPEVYFNVVVPGGKVVSLLYPASDLLPEIGDTGVGLLLMQVDAAGDTLMLIGKRASAESPPQPVMIDGADGLWIQGGVLTIEAGDPFWTYQGRSGNVLIWERNDVTYRMESDLPLDDAVAIAESLEPIDAAP